jgi:hypothetical protein
MEFCVNDDDDDNVFKRIQSAVSLCAAKAKRSCSLRAQAYVMSYVTYFLLWPVKLGKLVMWQRGREIITSTNEQD